ncbi:MAG: hypothetical protein DRN25_01235 [Thermoplasmata archaeon]|nr:MAG: hypothetical protein DRN25_01235 [Thermoplasmata archaeon]
MVYAKNLLYTEKYLWSLYEQKLMVRSEMYGFLSRMFLEPPPKLLIQDILNGNFFKIFENFPSNKKIREGLEKIKECSKKYRSVREFFEDVEDEYIKLFVGPFNPPVMLYESEYSPLGHKVLIDIKRAYRKAGLYKSDKVKEREDHLALQFEFMKLLCEKGETKLQKEFLQHLLEWATKVMKKIINSKEARFYKGIALIALGFFELEEEFLGLSPDNPS